MLRYSKKYKSEPDIALRALAPTCNIKKSRKRKIIAVNEDRPKIAKTKYGEVLPDVSATISETTSYRELDNAMTQKIAKKRAKNRTRLTASKRKKNKKSRLATVQFDKEDSPNLLHNKKLSQHSDFDKVPKISNKKVKQICPSTIVLRSKRRNESGVVTSKLCDDDSTLTNKLDIANPIVTKKEICGNNSLEDTSRIVKIDTRNKSCGIRKKKMTNLRVITSQPCNEVYTNMTSNPNQPISLDSLSTARKQKLRGKNETDDTLNMAENVTKKKSSLTLAGNKNKIKTRVVKSQLDVSQTTSDQDVEKISLVSSTSSEFVTDHKLTECDQSKKVSEIAKKMAKTKFYITNRPKSIFESGVIKSIPFASSMNSEYVSNDTSFESNLLDETLEVTKTRARKVYPSSRGIRIQKRIVTSVYKGTSNDHNSQVGTKITQQQQNHNEQTKFLNVMSGRNCEITCSNTSTCKIPEPNTIHILTPSNKHLVDYVESNESDKLSGSSYTTNDCVLFDGKVPRILLSDIDFKYKVKRSNKQYIEDNICESQPHHNQYYKDTIHTNRKDDTCKNSVNINQDKYDEISSSSDSFSSYSSTCDKVCTHSSNLHTKSGTSSSLLLNQRCEDKNNSIDCDVNLLINSQDVEFMSWISKKYNNHFKNKKKFMQIGGTLIEEAKVIEKCKSTKEKFKWAEENGLKNTHQNTESKEVTDAVMSTNAQAITKTNVDTNHTQSVNSLFSDNTQSVSGKQAIKNTVEFDITQESTSNTVVHCPDKTYDGDDDCISLYADSNFMLSENIHIDDTYKPQNLIERVVDLEANENYVRGEANLLAKDGKACPIVLGNKCDDWNQRIHPQSQKNTTDNNLSLSQFRAIPIVRSAIFSGVCVFNVISRCNKQDDRCRFMHRIPQQDEVANAIAKLNNINFIKEYLLLRKYPTLTCKYMHAFVKSCKDRALSRLLQEMAIDLYPLINPVTNEKSFWKAQLLETILLDMGNDKIMFCQDLLYNSLGNDYLVCDMFMDTIAGSQNFTQFQVIIELTRFYYSIKRLVKIKIATRILERTCMLQCQDDKTIHTVCEIILNTDPIVFQNPFIDKFESKLSINSSLYNKFRAAKEKALQLRWTNNNMMRKEVSDVSTQVNMPQLQYRHDLPEWTYDMNRDPFEVRQTVNNCDYPIVNRNFNNLHERSRINWIHQNRNVANTNYAYKPSCDDFARPQNSPYSSYSPRFLPNQLRQGDCSRRYSPILY